MAKRCPIAPPQPQPDAEKIIEHDPLGGRGGESGEQLDLLNKTTLSFIMDVHAAMQAAVPHAGGVTKLAEKMGKNHGEISQRLRRTINEGKGELMRGTCDMIGHIAAAGPPAQQAFLDSLLRAWGRKPSEPANIPLPQEQVRALVSSLIAAGPVGEAVLKEAAALGGFDPSVFKRR